jgi:hypothetical protein
MLIIVCSQILALVVFGVSIWALVDAPSFLDLFELVIYVSSIPGKMFFFSFIAQHSQLEMSHSNLSVFMQNSLITEEKNRLKKVCITIVWPDIQTFTICIHY